MVWGPGFGIREPRTENLYVRTGLMNSVDKFLAGSTRSPGWSSRQSVFH